LNSVNPLFNMTALLSKKLVRVIDPLEYRKVIKFYLATF
jgi:hypothetical protein